jgi:translation initiation factor 2-alpha kinase 4
LFATDAVQIVSFAQDWLRAHVIPPAEVVGSLALQMTQRAVEEARERERIEHEEAQKQREIAMMEAAALEYEISAAREQAQRSRRRANSEATEVPDVTIFDEDEDSMIETFSEMKLDSGIRFTSVRIYQPRAGMCCIS